MRRCESVTAHGPRIGRPLAVVLAVVAVLMVVTDAGASETSGPTLTATPRVAGAPTQGRRLFATHGSWNGEGAITFAYQWYRCDTMGRRCTALRGVTKRSHTVGPNDVGHTLSLAVSATDSAGSATAYSSLVGPIAGKPSAFVLSAQPLVAGDSVLGGTIRVDPGRWRPKPSGFSFQWARCNVQGRACLPITGATSDTHQVADDDLGHPLVAIVQARLGAATRAVFSVATTKAIASRSGSGPSNTGLPTASGELRQGKKLTADPGAWTGSGEIQFAYQWYRCDVTGAHCKSIHGATGKTYVQVAKDAGQTLGLGVQATDSGGATAVYGGLVGPVAATDAALSSTAQPSITGSATQGQVLQVSNGEWSQTPTAVGYQWQRCNANGRICAPIPGATAGTYAPVAEDVGHALVATVHATAGTAVQDALSATTRAVGTVPGPSITVPPTVTGTIQQSEKLIGAPGTWSASSDLTFGYQWYRCDAAGAHCKSIHGAKSTAYTQVAKDVGQTLGFTVWATDGTGTTIAYSSVVGPVAGANVKLAATAQPTIGGTPTQGQTLQVSNGAWSQEPTAYGYQWEQCNANGRVCVPIAGATASSYTLTPADAGHTLIAVVQATAGGTQQASQSTRSAVVS